MTEGSGPAKSKRGFALISPERRREIAAMGGKAIPADKRTFAKDPSLAAKAGRKGGQAARIENRTFSRFPDLARTAGKKGGSAGKAKSRQ